MRGCSILNRMEVYEYKNEYKIKYCDVDFKDELKASAALAYFEEVACASADELGFGYQFVKPRGYAFMVTNLVCEFTSPIALGEDVIFSTWPTQPTHVIFGREYRVRAKSGEVLANASSRWCLIDMESGRILPSKMVDNQDYSTYNPAKVFEKTVWKIPTFPLDEGELRFTFTVFNSEYDHNMHVNNTRYADYCLNCFSLAELSKVWLKGFSISYVKQCKEGQTLRFYRKQVAENEYVTQGVNEFDEVVVSARVLFGTKTGGLA